MERMLRFVFLVISALSSATWAEAETIDVKYYGKLDLAPFACTEVTRSSFINRACYDKANQFMVVQLKTVYYAANSLRTAAAEFPTLSTSFCSCSLFGFWANHGVELLAQISRHCPGPGRFPPPT
jgi:hypothetical protein